MQRTKPAAELWSNRSSKTMTSLSNAAEQFIVGLEKAEADLKAVAHRLEQEFDQSCNSPQVSGSLSVFPLKVSQSSCRC